MISYSGTFTPPTGNNTTVGSGAPAIYGDSAIGWNLQPGDPITEYNSLLNSAVSFRAINDVIAADSSTGDLFLILGTTVWAPQGYSGSNISGSMTFNNNTITGMGLNQSATWTYANGGATFATISPIPEPHEYVLYASLGLAGFGMFRRFRRSSSGVSV